VIFFERNLEGKTSIAIFAVPKIDRPM